MCTYDCCSFLFCECRDWLEMTAPAWADNATSYGSLGLEQWEEVAASPVIADFSGGLWLIWLQWWFIGVTCKSPHRFIAFVSSRRPVLSWIYIWKLELTGGNKSTLSSNSGALLLWFQGVWQSFIEFPNSQTQRLKDRKWRYPLRRNNGHVTPEKKKRWKTGFMFPILPVWTRERSALKA